MELSGTLFAVLFVAGFFSVLILGMDSGDTYFLKEFSDKVKAGPNAQRWENWTVRIRFFMGLAAVVLLAAALAVNVCGWISGGIAQHGAWLVSIDIGIALILFASIALERWRWRMLGSKKFTFSLPRWSRAVLIAFFVYVVSAFIFDSSQSYLEQRSTAKNGGVQLELTPEQHARNQRRAVRSVSNIWLLVSSVCAAGLLLAEQKERGGPFGKFNSVVQQL